MPRPRSRRPRIGALAVATTLLATAGLQIASPSGPAGAAPTEHVITQPGPLGPITVIGDSVALGGLLYSPTLPQSLAQRGWGPVRMRAGEGYSTGNFSTHADWKATYWIARWRSEGWDPTDIVVNLGANDSGRCGGNADCAYAAIMFLVDAIGPGHRIWWPKITRFYTKLHEQNAWNAALDRVDAERADFWTWDWPTEMRVGGYSSPDMTHLSADSYRRRSHVMAREITADLAFARHTGGDAALAATLGEPTEFVALAPRRVLDTRGGGGLPIAAQTHVDIDLTGQVPPGTTAVAVNLTSDQSSADGFLTGFPCDRQRADASNVNHGTGVPRGALAVVPLSATGHLCVHTHATGHVIVDLQGAFLDGSPDGLRFTPSEPPARLLDTRDTGRAEIVEVTVPAGAEAVAVNLTATNATVPGWLKAFPCSGQPPEVSNVNYLPGDTVAGAAFVPVSDAGTICVQSMNAVDVIVDLTGVFAADGELRFVPVEPTRMLDTRSGIGGWTPYQGSGQTIDVRVVPDSAQAVTGTMTLVGPMRAGWLKAFDCAVEPPTSNVNAGIDQVLANGVTVGVGDGGRLCTKPLAATHTLFDVTGWWVA